MPVIKGDNLLFRRFRSDITNTGLRVLLSLKLKIHVIRHFSNNKITKNYPISSDSDPSATANTAIYCLK